MKPEPLKEKYRYLSGAEKILVLALFSQNHRLEAYNTKYIKSKFMRSSWEVKAFFIEQGQLLWREIEKIEIKG